MFGHHAFKVSLADCLEQVLTIGFQMVNKHQEGGMAGHNAA
jgi:hypothetical protein